MRGLFAATVLAAVLVGWPLAAYAGAADGNGVIVIKDTVTEVDHEATVLPGCSGAFVPMSFTGVNLFHTRIFPDGTASLAVHVQETATWTEDGVTHTVPFANNFTFNPIDPVDQTSQVITVTLHGVGMASDGTTTKIKLVGHIVTAADGTVKLDFTKGSTECGL
jgi:hypothetical protein